MEQTTNYSLFKFKNTNRSISEDHIKELVSSICKWGNITTILVDKEMRIIDGQHRFVALRSLNEPINYKVIDESSDELIIDLNNSCKTWNMNDYLELFCKNKNAYYCFIKELTNKYKFLRINSLISIFSATTNLKRFKEGSFQFSNQEKESGLNFIRELVTMKEVYNIKYACQTRFIWGYLAVRKHKAFNWEHFEDQLRKYQSLLCGQINIAEYAKNLGYVYNYKTRNKLDFTSIIKD